MSGCSRIRSTATLSPWTTLNTPSGTPASRSSSRQEQRRRRVFLGRLEDERVAAGDGVAEHPHRHHRREVERRDPGDDAQRLADLVHVDAARDLLAEAALEQMRDAAGELEVLEPARDLTERVRRDLAVLGGQQRRDARAGACRRGSGSGTGSRCASRATWRASPGRPPWRRRPLRRPPRPTRSRPTSPGAPVAGSKTGPRRPERPATCRPPIQWPMDGSEVDVASLGSATWVMGCLRRRAGGRDVRPSL